MKKKSFRYLFFTVIGFMILTFVNIYATTVLDANLVDYDNSTSSLSSNNVQDVIDELYTDLVNRDECPDGYICRERRDYLKVGDYVKMTPTLESYETDPDYTGYSISQTINPQELNLWRVLKINDDGTVDLISEYVSSTEVYFTGFTGYKNFTGYLNVLASKYENDKYTIGSRNSGYNGQTEYLSDMSYVDTTTKPWSSYRDAQNYESLGGGEELYRVPYNLIKEVLGTGLAYKIDGITKGTYWFSSRYYDSYYEDGWTFSLTMVSTTGNNTYYHYIDYRKPNFSFQELHNSLRPIVVLKNDINYKPATGLVDDPFVLE